VSPSIPSLKKETTMNTNKTSNAQEANAAAANANTENVNAAGAEQTNAKGDPAADTKTEQAAPGGAKGEEGVTWTLRMSFNVRNIAKWVINIAAYMSTFYALNFFAVWMGALGMSALMMVAVEYGLILCGMYFFFSTAMPAINTAVDYTADKATSAWTKVKSWFKKSDVVATPAPAAA